MKKFRDYAPNQLLLLPPNLNEWLPAGHLARFINDVVEEVLDLSDIFDAYDSEKGGQPPYHPTLMVKVLLYGYSVGTFSSREIEKNVVESIPFRFLAANQKPDHSSISLFRKRHLKALSGLFQQALYLAMKEGLVGMELVAVDGTKLEANANKNKSMSLDTLSERERKLQGFVDRVLAEAERIDDEEDRKYGSKSLLDIQKVEVKIERLKQLKKQMDEEKKAQEEQQNKARDEKPNSGKRGRKKRKVENANQDSDSKKASEKGVLRRNLTDYESRIMRVSGGNWIQGYNAQAVVDDKAQVIIACDVTNETSDVKQLHPMLLQAIQNTGTKPKVAVADKGYFASSALRAKELRDVELLIPPPRDAMERKWTRGAFAFRPSDDMREKLRNPEKQKLYRRRQITVEPVFGQLKAALGFRKFSFRGKDFVRREWSLVCAAHNLLKVFRHRWSPTPS